MGFALAVVSCRSDSPAAIVTQPTIPVAPPTITPQVVANCVLPTESRYRDDWFAFSGATNGCRLQLPPACSADVGVAYDAPSTAKVSPAGGIQNPLTCNGRPNRLFVRNVPGEDPQRIVSHALVTSPHNTIANLRAVRDIGLAAIEIDVRFTSDSIPVLLHDETIDRTSTGTGSISKMTYAQALTYDFGVKTGSAFRGEVIPTLDSAMAWLAANKFPLVIVELKDFAPFKSYQEAIDRVHAIAAARHVPNWWLASFSSAALRLSRIKDPKVPLVLYSDAAPGVDYMAEVRRTNPEYLALPYTALDLKNLSPLMNELKALNSQLIVWGTIATDVLPDIAVAQSAAPIYYTPFPWANVDRTP